MQKALVQGSNLESNMLVSLISESNGAGALLLQYNYKKLTLNKNTQINKYHS